MGVDYDAVLAYGWEIDPVKAGTALGVEDPGPHEDTMEAICKILKCGFHTAGSSYSGELTFYIDVNNKNGRLKLSEVAGIVPNAARIRAILEDKGIAVGEAEIISDLHIW